MTTTAPSCIEQATDADWAYARMNWRFGLTPRNPFEVHAFAVFAAEAVVPA